MTARTRSWVLRASAWGLATLVAAAPAHHLIVWLYVTYPGVWAALLAACVFAVASGLSAEFGADTPAPDTVDDALAADLAASGGAS
ncbi:MAG TPA: hypothetical protein VFM55_19070 [Micromonosporaceae bacterium]|nr:hypothetical protein [Micromonosporaceae bacterium]